MNEKSVDTKLFSNQRLNPTGFSLLISLGVGLSLAALIFDWTSGKLFSAGSSLIFPLWLSALITAGLGYWVLPLLQAIKAGQFIREDGPQTHLKKAGTPTMGGVFFVPVGLIVALLWSEFILGMPDIGPAIAVSLLTLAYATIGWVDDLQILLRRSNKGISPKMKLVWQIAVAVLFCLWLFWSQPAGITTIALPFGWAIPLGLLFWPLAAFAIVGESNSTNLTDGVEQLAIMHPEIKM